MFSLCHTQPSGLLPHDRACDHQLPELSRIKLTTLLPRPPSLNGSVVTLSLVAVMLAPMAYILNEHLAANHEYVGPHKPDALHCNACRWIMHLVYYS